MTQFTGFPKQTLTFLRGIARNNDKAWFDEHRTDYEHHWLAPARDFVLAAGDALRSIAPAVRAEPKVNGSIFRVNRDIRFSADKRPYKDHLDFWFWEGERKTAVSGFYLRVSPASVGIGVGAHGFDKNRLATYRAAVVNQEHGPALARVVASVERRGYPVQGERYKETPRGFDPANARQERLLRYGALFAGVDEKPTPDLHTAAFVPHALCEWKRMAPLHRWLVDTLQ